MLEYVVGWMLQRDSWWAGWGADMGLRGLWPSALWRALWRALRAPLGGSVVDFEADALSVAMHGDSVTRLVWSGAGSLARSVAMCDGFVANFV